MKVSPKSSLRPFLHRALQFILFWLGTTKTGSSISSKKQKNGILTTLHFPLKLTSFGQFLKRVYCFIFTLKMLGHRSLGNHFANGVIIVCRS